MSYNEKYPDMSAMYSIMFETEDKLKNKIKELETKLECTRKALNVAKEGLKEIQDKGEYVNPIELAESYLDEITALEQKDVK